MDVIKRIFYIKKQKNCPIFYATSKDLRDFTTTEKDMKKEIVKFPTPNYRTTEEDLFDENASASQVAAASSATANDNGMFNNQDTGEADMVEQQKIRGKQLTADVSFDRTSSDVSTEDTEVRQSMAGGADAIFARN